MSQFFNKNYFLDIDNISNVCKIETKKTDKTDEINTDDVINEEDFTVNIFKYETIKMCIDRLLNEYEDDEQDIFPQKNSTTSFWIAFNTLIKYKILIEEDE